MIQEGSKYIIFPILKKMENSNFSPKFYCWTPLRKDERLLSEDERLLSEHQRLSSEDERLLTEYEHL